MIGIDTEKRSFGTGIVPILFSFNCSIVFPFLFLISEEREIAHNDLPSSPTESAGSEFFL